MLELWAQLDQLTSPLVYGHVLSHPLPVILPVCEAIACVQLFQDISTSISRLRPASMLPHEKLFQQPAAASSSSGGRKTFSWVHRSRSESISIAKCRQNTTYAIEPDHKIQKRPHIACS
jgi:hypothetical protein